MIILFLTITPFSHTHALERPDMEFKVFQFPHNMIPRIDGNSEDWDIVPEEYKYGNDLMINLLAKEGESNKVDPGDFRCTVCVGWVKGFNRLYILYEAYDDYWEFRSPSVIDNIHIVNDKFELSVDTDLSGGSFIWRDYYKKELVRDFGVPPQKNSLGQNYHFMTPNRGKSLALMWNAPAWLIKFPYTNCEYSYDFKTGESGNLFMECWITTYDYASFKGPEYSSQAQLKENDIIGLSWLIGDLDGGIRREDKYSLSHDNAQIHNGSALCAFRLMPLEKDFLEAIKADFTFKVIDSDLKIVAFKDCSDGEITSWLWDFGDGTASTEQNPVHLYKYPVITGDYRNSYSYFVTLQVESSEGKSLYESCLEVIIK